MKCNVCNAEIDDNAKFCTVCGAKVELEIKCPNCGVIVGKDAKFCTECGCKIERERKCPKCGTKIYEGTKFCTNCGAKIDAGSDDNGISPVVVNNNIDTQVETLQTSVSSMPLQVPIVENNELPKEEINTETVVQQATEMSDNAQISNYKSDSFDVMAYESAISNIYKNAICVIFVIWGISVVLSFIPYVGSILNGLIGLVWFGFYIYYIVCLSRLVKVVHPNDVPAIKKLRLSSILFASLPVVAIICSLILSAGISSVGIYNYSRLDAVA